MVGVILPSDLSTWMVCWTSAAAKGSRGWRMVCPPRKREKLSESSPKAGRKYLDYINGKTWQELGARLVPGLELAVGFEVLGSQSEDRDALFLRVHDPIFGNLRLGVGPSFFLEVPVA